MNSKERAFQKRVRAWYEKNGRHALPWRSTTNPYRILVSEVMLQQTQVERVIPKYRAFVRAYPTVEALAAASLHDVLTHWQGLGYNRRARMLHLNAKSIVRDHKGAFPKTASALEQLAGVGPYTARAVLIFAYNQPEVCIETNIRTVFLHEFFKNKEAVSDKELLPYIERTLDTTCPRIWYAALMDYGTHLKKTTANPSRKSTHHTTQKPFKGSLRETRGSILKLLLQKPCTHMRIVKEATGTPEAVATALEALHKEGLIEKQGRRWRVAT